MIKVLALLLGCFALASSPKAPRILYGRRVSQEQLMANFQFIALVLLNCDANNICKGCTGTLIKPNEVLLAAHCFCDDQGALIKAKKDIFVYFNSTVSERGRRVYAYFGKIKPRYECRKTVSAGMFDFQGHIDAATIRLEENITDILPVTLQEQHLLLAPEQEVVVIGFGLDENNSSAYLKTGDTTTRDCDPHRRYPTVTGVYCVDGNQEGRPVTYVGDSGGPLLIRRNTNPYGFVQIGVTHGTLNLPTYQCNNGQRERIPDKAAAFTKVSVHYNWIMLDRSSYFRINVNKRIEDRNRRGRSCCVS